MQAMLAQRLIAELASVACGVEIFPLQKSNYKQCCCKE
jgi:hypothetical protein